MPSETASLNVTRKITGSSKDENIYRSEVIEVTVKATCLEKYGLDDVEIWEIPGKNLVIQNCSYPITTSSIKTMLDYETFDKSILRDIDIEDYDDIIYIKKLLTNNTSILYPIPLKNPTNNSYKIYLYINKILSQGTREALNRTESRKDLDILKKYIINYFNKLINSNSCNDINVSLLEKYDIDIDRTILDSYNCISNETKIFNDRQLIKRRLIKYIFPLIINQMSYYKEHENLYINKTRNIISFHAKDLYQGETIIFKYYLYPNKLGNSEIRSIIRTKGYLREEVTPIKIIERGERFNVNYWSDSKDLLSGEPERFVYFIEYLGGNDSQNEFPISFEAQENCELGKNIHIKDANGSWVIYKKEKPFIGGKESTSRILSLPRRSFLKGKIEEIAVNVTYNESGLRLSPPRISIGRFTKEDFDADISVFTKANMKSKINYESISILILFITAIISLVSIFELIQAKRERDAFKKIIEHNSVAITALKTFLEDRR